MNKWYFCSVVITTTIWDSTMTSQHSFFSIFFIESSFCHAVYYDTALIPTPSIGS